MADARAPLKQSEVTRYAKGLQAAGIEEWRIEIEAPDGTRIAIVAGKGAGAATPSDDIDAMIARLP